MWTIAVRLRVGLSGTCAAVLLFERPSWAEELTCNGNGDKAPIFSPPATPLSGRPVLVLAAGVLLLLGARRVRLGSTAALAVLLALSLTAVAGPLPAMASNGTSAWEGALHDVVASGEAVRARATVDEITAIPEMRGLLARLDGGRFAAAAMSPAMSRATVQSLARPLEDLREEVRLLGGLPEHAARQAAALASRPEIARWLRGLHVAFSHEDFKRAAREGTFSPRQWNLVLHANGSQCADREYQQRQTNRAFYVLGVSLGWMVGVIVIALLPVDPVTKTGAIVQATNLTAQEIGGVLGNMVSDQAARKRN